MYQVLTGLVPDIIHYIETEMGPGKGPEKLKAALDLLEKGLIAANIPGFVVKIILAIAAIIIPKFVARYNADPANTIFIKP